MDKQKKYLFLLTMSYNKKKQKIVKNIKKEIIYKNFTEIDFFCKCQSCSKTKRSSQMAIISNLKYRQICKQCAINYGYKRCIFCSKYYAPDLSCPCDYKKPTTPRKERFNYQANWIKFQVNKNDVILFGIELEVEGNGKQLNKTGKVYSKPWIIYKHDGSLSNGGENGFEIVTMPLGWEWIKKNKKEFDDIFDLAKIGYKSRCTNTCGMHIHIAKTAFTTYHLYKFYQFHYKNKHLLYLLSGRSWANMIRWASFNEGIEEQAKFYAKSKYCNNRHSAINLMNPESVEIRIFRGTLSPAPFWRNIQFVKSIYDYTKYIKLKDMENIDLYKDYVKKNKKEFPYLHNFFDKDLKGEILCV